MSFSMPDRWKERLRAYLRERRGEDRETLSAYDFRADESLRIQFPYGSHVHFCCAFAIEDHTLREVAVFTEHCGYHVFPLGQDTIVEVVRSVEPTA